MPSPTRLFAFFLAVLLVFLGALGFFLLFGAYSPLGQEGESLLAARAHFVDGGLYGALFSRAGPFFFAVTDLVQVFLGPLDSTGARVLALGSWLVCAGTCGYGVLRATRNFALSGFAAGGVFLSLYSLRFEPLHPGVMVLFLLGLLVLFAGHSLDLVERPFRYFGIAAGSIAACVLMSRFNVGVPLGAGLACFFIASFAGEGRLWRTLLLVLPPLVAAALMVPLVSQPWVRTFILCFSGMALALGVNCSHFPRTNLSVRHFWLGFFVMLVLAAAYPLLRGARVGDLLEGAILLPMLRPGDYVHQIDWRPEALPLMFVSLGFALAYAWSRGKDSGRVFEHVLVALRLLQFLLLGVSLVFLQDDLAGAVYSFCLLFSWTWCAPLLVKNPTAQSLRVLLGYMLLFLSLHAYPSGGRQQAWGFFLLYPLVAIGMRETQVWASRIGFLQMKRSLQVAGVFSLLLVLGDGGRLLWKHYREYEGRQPLGFPGTAGLRLGSEETLVYRNLVLNAQEHGSHLLSLPGQFCLNLWSGVGTPDASNLVSWPSALPLERQKAQLALVEREPRACLVVNERLFVQDEQEGPVLHGPLYLYVREHFEKAYQVGDYTFAARKGRHVLPLEISRLVQKAGEQRLCFSIRHLGTKIAGLRWAGGQASWASLGCIAVTEEGRLLGGLSQEELPGRKGYLQLSLAWKGPLPERLEVLDETGRVLHTVLPGI